MAGTFNLMQNCDLPPPVKLFSSPDNTSHLSISKLYENVGGNESKGDKQQFLHMYKDLSGDIDKLEILKALRLSQTRAREAERKLRIITKEKYKVSNFLVDESSRLFAYRQWVHLMEIQVLILRRQKEEMNRQSESNCEENLWEQGGCDEGNSSKSWFVAVAFCLAIAGMGFAFGCRYNF